MPTPRLPINRPGWTCHHGNGMMRPVAPHEITPAKEVAMPLLILAALVWIGIQLGLAGTS